MTDTDNMEKAVAKLTKENHLNSLLNGLPMLTTLYGINCLMIHYAIEGIDIGVFSLSLGLILITFVTSLFIYDKYHHVLLYDSHLLIYFQPLHIGKKIAYHEISEIIAPEGELEFCSLLIKLKNKETFSIHFVDYPHHVKAVLLEMMAAKHEPRQNVA